jgi:hypothetical protein
VQEQDVLTLVVAVVVEVKNLVLVVLVDQEL